MTDYRRVVQARTRNAVELRAARVRADLGLDPADRVNMAKLVDLGLIQMIEGYEMHVVGNRVLGAAEAVTDLNRPVITFSERTYEALYRDDARARMTAAHEVGHLMLHSRQTVGLAFMRGNDPLVDPERQADIFAAAFLMPEAAFRKMKSIDQAMKFFGVSRDAATCRARKLRMDWLIQGRAPPKIKKKGSKPMTRSP